MATKSKARTYLADEDGDENVLFLAENDADRKGLIDQKLKPMHEVVDNSLANKKGRFTLMLCLSFIGLGLTVSLLGPTLLSIKDSINGEDGTIIISDTMISYVFTVRGLGYLVGSFIGGLMFDSFNSQLLLTFVTFSVAVFTALVPFSKTQWMLAGSILLWGGSMGALDTGGNVVCVNLWGTKSAPFMQALHFSFGAGAFIAPLVAQPFIESRHYQLDSELYNCSDPELDSTTEGMKRDSEESKRSSNDDDDKTTTTPTNSTTEPAPTTESTTEPAPTTESTTETAPTTESTTEPAPTTESTTEPANTTESTTEPANTTESTTKPTTKSPTTLTKNAAEPHSNGTENHGSFIPISLTSFQTAYLIVACILFVVSAVFFCVYFNGSGGVKNTETKNTVSQVMMLGVKDTDSDQVFRLQMMAALFFFFFLYVGMEVAYGGQIFRYATMKCFNKNDAIMLNSLFWGSFALARLFAICATRYMSPKTMLIVDILGCLASSIALTAASENSTVLWVGTAALGLSMSSIFPAGISWAERYLKITGRMTALFVVGSSCGEMVIPWVVGSAMSQVHPKSLMICMLVVSVLCLFLFSLMHIMASRQGERYAVHRAGPEEYLDVLQEIVEMDSMSGGGSKNPSKLKQSFLKHNGKKD